VARGLVGGQTAHVNGRGNPRVAERSDGCHAGAARRRVGTETAGAGVAHEPSRSPPLGHEYQFELDSAAGKLALDRALKFLAGLKL
jgi:hypothetical protein